MERAGSIAWRLSALVIIIVTVTLSVAAGLEHLIAAHYSLESARTILSFDSESTVRGIEELMMSRANAEVETYISNRSGDSTVYGEIRLISHENGEIVASRSGDHAEILAQDDRLCASCHSLEDPILAGTGAQDEVFEGPSGDRTLSVVTPILNRQSCQTAACHAHPDANPILGFLQTDYSLGMLESSFARRNAYTFLVVILAVISSALALALLFKGTLQRPIRGLIRGTRRLADGDLAFRFPVERRDEIGELEESFNAMAGRILEHQSELHKTLGYLEGIIESSADIIITVSQEHLIQTFNRGAEQALGYTRDEVRGKRILMLFARPEDRDIALARLNDTDNVRNFATRFRTRDGQIRDVLLTLSRLRDPQGNPVGTFGISKDITEEKRLLRQLIQSKKLAAIGQAVTGIQHAIKNMLVALQGGAYLVRTGMRGEDRERLAGGWAMVEDGIEQITGLSDNMLSYARDWKPELEDVDLGRLVTNVQEAVRQHAGDKGIAVRGEQAGALPAAWCDPKLIRLAVADIVANAIQACEWKEYDASETPEVLLRVQLSDSEDLFVIEISDNGCGMKEEIVRDIFVPFFSTKKEMGTGVGLATTARVIEIHDGRIEVESRPDVGSTFRISLPARGPVQPKEQPNGQEGTSDRR